VLALFYVGDLPNITCTWDPTCICSQGTELELMLIEISVSDIVLPAILMERGNNLGGPESCSATCGVEQPTSKT